MTIKEVLKQIEDIKENHIMSMSINDILNKLYTYDKSEEITFTNGQYLNGDWGSYRGYYSDMFIGVSEDDKEVNKVVDLIDVLENALEHGTMEGWKGGTYSIDYDTFVWSADHGELGDMIVDIQKINNEILVITKEDM